MSHTLIPQGYTSPLGIYDTQAAIGRLKTIFEETISVSMRLKRVSAPLVVVIL